MKSRLLKKVIVLFAAVATSHPDRVCIPGYLDKRIDEMYHVSDYTKVLNQQFDDNTKDKGQLILERSADNGNVILLGSSELSPGQGRTLLICSLIPRLMRT